MFTANMCKVGKESTESVSTFKSKDNELQKGTYQYRSVRMNMTGNAQSQYSIIRKWRKVKEELEKENWRQMEDLSFL